MLEDRSYMRREPRESRTSVCAILIAVLVGVYLVQLMGAGRLFDFNEYLALSKSGLKNGYFWQLLTFQFLHSGPWPWHLLVNCLALYFFGREVEQALGPANFLKLYFGSGLVGGLLQAGVMFLPIPGANVTVMGASAGVAGVFAGFAMLFPHREVMLFLLPIRIKAQHVFWAFLVLSIAGTVFPFGQTAHAAHLGGIAAAYAYLRWGTQAEAFFSQRRSTRARVRPRELMKVPLGRNSPWQRSKSEAAELSPDEFISREVDPILDKISAHGIQSLTTRERQILEAARSKMEKR
jgi:membrane associated rhomboid family serine protease